MRGISRQLLKHKCNQLAGGALAENGKELVSSRRGAALVTVRPQEEEEGCHIWGFSTRFSSCDNLEREIQGLNRKIGELETQIVATEDQLALIEDNLRRVGDQRRSDQRLLKLFNSFALGSSSECNAYPDASKADRATAIPSLGMLLSNKFTTNREVMSQLLADPNNCDKKRRTSRGATSRRSDCFSLEEYRTVFSKMKTRDAVVEWSCASNERLLGSLRRAMEKGASSKARKRERRHSSLEDDSYQKWFHLTLRRLQSQVIDSPQSCLRAIRRSWASSERRSTRKSHQTEHCRLWHVLRRNEETHVDSRSNETAALTSKFVKSLRTLGLHKHQNH